MLLLLSVLLAGCTAVDSDGDGLSDIEELSLHTDAKNPDTDGDGVNDGDEVRLGLNPLLADTDSDGITDGKELEMGTDPLSKDSDGDGLLDGDELRLGTNPLATDTDGDGLEDGIEIKHGTSPLITDSDGDGLPDGEEFKQGSSPLKVDTDGDGLEDSYEVLIGSDPAKSWRLSFDEAIKSALCKRYLEQVGYVAQSIKGDDTLEIVWNVLDWVDEYIEYNQSKAAIENAQIQTPYETIVLGNGICTDYTFLTAAILLNLGIGPYILEIKYEGREVGHACVAVEVGGELFVLDQNLPLKHLASYCCESELKGDKIDKILIHKVRRAGEGVEVETEEIDEFGKLYSVTSADIEDFRDAVSKFFRSKYGYKENERLKSVSDKELECVIKGYECTIYLPRGFTKGMTYWVAKPSLYYHPALKELLANWVVESIDDLKGYTSFYVSAGLKDLHEFETDDGKTVKTKAIVVVIAVAR
ncbi:protein of unknown function DUF553 [Archaeoglobus veneficus SNP6]|uniref:Transglutaminase-like domain-containing protein n=2 Tax=Archaeoglobus veneficus TaxID=58290 RepID=F2KSL2_ARCVS|nr:protein of unknown function DUF553 [Archaeoglobus veneficus SNP6]